MIDFDCKQFARWLDDGGAGGAHPDPELDACARVHAAECSDCARLLAADRSVDTLLRSDVPADRSPGYAAAPPGFADFVMAQVALTPQVKIVGEPVRLPGLAALPTDVLPWWIRAAAQPAGVLALVLAGVAAAFTPQLLGVSRSVPAWSAGVLARLAGWLAPGIVRANAILGGDPWILTGVTLALLPLVALASIALYRLGVVIAATRLASPLRVATGIRRA